MQLGQLIRTLEDEARAMELMLGLGDLVLLAEVQAMAAMHDETLGEYASGAARRFASAAKDEDWLALRTILERDTDSAAGCLKLMLRWSLREDGRSQHTCGGSVTTLM